MPDLHEEEVLGKAYDARLARRLVRYAWAYRGLIAASLVLLLIDGALQLVGPMLTRRVIDVALPARDEPAIVRAALLFAGALLAQFACAFGETVLTARLGQHIMHDLRTQIFSHLQRLPVAFFDRNPVGRLVTRVTSDVEALNELFTSGVVAGLGDLFALGTISVLLLLVDWRLALASFGVIPLVVLASSVFRVRVREAYRTIRTRLARINAYLNERLSGVRVVQLFGREPNEAARFDRLNRDHLDAHLRSVTVYALYFPVIEILTTIAIASLVVTAAARIAHSAVTVGTVAAFLQLLRRFFDPLQDLSDKYNTLQQAMASSERIFRLIDEPAATGGGLESGDGDRDGVASRMLWADDRGDGGRGAPPEHHHNTPRSHTDHHSVSARTISAPPQMASPLVVPSSFTQHGAIVESPARADGATVPPVDPLAPPAPVAIEFDHVWFAYALAHTARGAEAPVNPEWVLKDVSFVARPDTTLAIVGHTGAGKTTIINLLLRFYEPQRGRILVNGVDVRLLDTGEVRRLIGYVQQDIFLFAGDIISNIRLASAISDTDVRRAAERVGADRIIARLPGGYAYELGERGASVSVGERQLLSFARAIAADPAVLVLDEATSAVDSEIEAEIQLALAELMRGRTTIAIAHRLSTVQNADEILVMHHGEIRERGTHRELLARRGIYERLYRLQTGANSHT